jgi:hypothetical protein
VRPSSAAHAGIGNAVTTWRYSSGRFQACWRWRKNMVQGPHGWHPPGKVPCRFTTLGGVPDRPGRQPQRRAAALVPRGQRVCTHACVSRRWPDALRLTEGAVRSLLAHQRCRGATVRAIAARVQRRAALRGRGGRCRSASRVAVMRSPALVRSVRSVMSVVGNPAISPNLAGA